MPRWLSGFDAVLSVLERGLLVVSVIAFIGVGLLMGAAILSREFFGFGVPDDAVIVSQLMLVSITCALGYVTAQRAHIAIDILYDKLGPRTRYVLDLISSLAGLIAFIPIALWAFGDLSAAYQTGRLNYGQLQLPMWPSYLFFALGLSLMCLRLVVIFMTDLLAGAGKERSVTFVKLDIG
jgi:TRAP-type C4-dicarboxylate transport system permease small subunit